MTAHSTTASHVLARPSDLSDRDYIALLERRQARLFQHHAFGVPNRYALNETWPALDLDGLVVVVCDLDGLNALNEQHTQAGVDARIRATFAALRSEVRHGDGLFQADGGDQFLWLLPRAADADAGGQRETANPVAAAHRLQALLVEHGLSASFGIVYPDADLVGTITRAEKLYKAARGGARGVGVRGVVVDGREVAS